MAAQRYRLLRRAREGDFNPFDAHEGFLITARKLPTHWTLREAYMLVWRECRDGLTAGQHVTDPGCTLWVDDYIRYIIPWAIEMDYVTKVERSEKILDLDSRAST
jgi:hypothetical protein